MAENAGAAVTVSPDIFLNAVLEAKESIIPIGTPITITESDIGKTHEVTITGAQVVDNLEYADIDSEFIAECFLEDAKSPPNGQKLLVIDVQIKKISQGKPNEYTSDSEQLGDFSLSNWFIIGLKNETLNSEMIGFVQPEISRMPESKQLYFANIPNEGESIDCKLVYFVASSFDCKNAMFIQYDGKDAILAALADSEE